MRWWDLLSVTWFTIGVACVMAILTPLVLIIVRHEIRIRRIRLIDEFSRNFGGVDHSPSFEFVKSKYAVDLDYYPPNIEPKAIRELKLLENPDVDKYINELRWYHLRSNWRLLRASVPYVLICFAGFFTATFPLLQISDGADYTLRDFIDPSLFTGGGLNSGTDPDSYFEHVATIAAITFIGAYLFTLRLFIRAVSVFDLNPITFLRAAAHIVLSVAAVIILWRALPDPTAPLTWILSIFSSSGQATQALSEIPKSWFLLAFVLGFVPESAIEFMFTKVTALIQAMKTSDDRFSRYAKSTPLDMIDGIDFFTRFRLEEANIFEVQNLAVANPIMLHIETPFGIYQTIDWVAQAQLCTVVGAERFVLMRQYNIRTVFDLERVVLSTSSTPQLRRFVASLLLISTQTTRDLTSATKSTFNGIGGEPSSDLTAQQFNGFVAELFGEPGSPKDPEQSIKHLVRVIVDDLHVHRLRQIWQSIAHQLGSKSAGLDDSERFSPPPPAPHIATVPAA